MFHLPFIYLVPLYNIQKSGTRLLYLDFFYCLIMILEVNKCFTDRFVAANLFISFVSGTYVGIDMWKPQSQLEIEGGEICHVRNSGLLCEFRFLI